MPSTRRSRNVSVFRYKRLWPTPEYLPEWGTHEAISAIECIPMLPTERIVDANHLDGDGFLPYGTTPDDVVN